MQYTKANTIKNTLSPKNTLKHVFATNSSVWNKFTMPNENVYKCVDIWGQQPWPDIITIYF